MNKVFLALGTILPQEEFDEKIFDEISETFAARPNFYLGTPNAYTEDKLFFGRIIAYLDEGTANNFMTVIAQHPIPKADEIFLKQSFKKLCPTHLDYFTYYIIYTTFD